MLSFLRMVAAALCLVCYTIEHITTNLTGSTGILLQCWIFMEWLGYRAKDGEGDVLLAEVLPILAQLMLMIRVLLE